MTRKQKLSRLEKEIKNLYQKHSKKLLYHGWHHIYFCLKKSTYIAREIKADVFLVSSAALVHDLNYIIKPFSEPEIGRAKRQSILKKTGYDPGEIERVEKIVMESHTRTRNKKISKEGAALSDADALFKALPTTPILFASRYMVQNKVDIKKLARKVCSEQNKLMKQNIYFYTSVAKKNYLKWAKANLALWNNVEDALKDKDIKEMLNLARKARAI